LIVNNCTTTAYCNAMSKSDRRSKHRSAVRLEPINNGRTENVSIGNVLNASTVGPHGQWRVVTLLQHTKHALVPADEWVQPSLAVQHGEGHNPLAWLKVRNAGAERFGANSATGHGPREPAAQMAPGIGMPHIQDIQRDICNDQTQCISTRPHVRDVPIDNDLTRVHERWEVNVHMPCQTGADCHS
jgi:hypothetical protein